MQKLIFSVTILFMVVGGFYYVSLRGIYKKDLYVSSATNSFVTKKFYVRIAQTEKDKQLGLGGTYSMCAECGMLFIFDDQGEKSFWMKDMKIDIDMLFIGGDKKVVKVFSRVDRNKYPETYSANARYVLELNAGTVSNVGIREGDMVNW